MWRTELWHSFIVHLPLVCLALCSFFSFISIFFQKTSIREFIHSFINLMLLIGIIGGWIGIYTGELSYNIEVRRICDPDVLQSHQWWAYATMISYTIAFIAFLLYYYSQIRIWNFLGNAINIIALVALIYVGHLGASLVYQQGAGVYHPSEDCTEFEK